jgi:ABC-type glycerol-3-phosphate transport system permease component|tara:strand:+ start:29 stop:334 length:306 start_codon:yes stop_codon:yes gene_type:complete
MVGIRIGIKRRQLGQVSKVLILIGASIIILFPIYFVFMTSIRGKEELLYHEVAYYPKEVTLDHYLWVFENSDFLLYFGNSLRIARTLRLQTIQPQLYSVNV